LCISSPSSPVAAAKRVRRYTRAFGDFVSVGLFMAFPVRCHLGFRALAFTLAVALTVLFIISFAFCFSTATKRHSRLECSPAVAAWFAGKGKDRGATLLNRHRQSSLCLLDSSSSRVVSGARALVHSSILVTFAPSNDAFLATSFHSGCSRTTPLHRDRCSTPK
jgi:hypothetical protein